MSEDHVATILVAEAQRPVAAPPIHELSHPPTRPSPFCASSSRDNSTGVTLIERAIEEHAIARKLLIVSDSGGSILTPPRPVPIGLRMMAKRLHGAEVDVRARTPVTAISSSGSPKNMADAPRYSVHYFRNSLGPEAFM